MDVTILFRLCLDCILLSDHFFCWASMSLRFQLGIRKSLDSMDINIIGAGGALDDHLQRQ